MRPRTVGALIALDAVVSAAWAFTTTITTAGPPPLLHLTLSPVLDAQQLALMVTPDTTALLAALAAANTACYLVTGLRARRKTLPAGQPLPAGTATELAEALTADTERRH